jgi:hypothetical protein
VNIQRRLTPLFLFVVLAPANADAQDACEAASPLDGQRFLRRLSLDLRGTTPTSAEISAQSGKEEVTDAQIDDLLGSDGFRDVMKRYHANLLWPNIDQIELIDQVHQIFPYELAPGVTVYFSALRAVVSRAVGNGNIFIPCLPEPARFDANGELIMTPLVVGGETVAYQEGYVEVEPYWAPGTQVKVCGLDAQPAVSAPVCPGPGERYPFVEPFCAQIGGYDQFLAAPFRGQQIDCGSRFAQLAPGCGCGPNLVYCQTPDTTAEIKRDLLDQMLRITDKVVAEGRPYHEILTTKRIEFSGPISHYLRYQSRLNFDLYTDADVTAAAPELDYNDNSWVGAERSGRHAGILTTPGYLLRFQTNRGRAHRFYNAFECSSFIPAGPLPSPTEACSKHEDLTKRCGCDACHRGLEPMAASWGRFTEYGFMYLDEQAFPDSVGTRCSPPIDSVETLFRCFRFYELDPVGEEVPFQGALNSYVFRTPEEIARIVAGPTSLVEEGLDTGLITRCTVKKMWGQLMRREPTVEEETEVLPTLISSFEANGHDLKALLKEIAREPAYRRAP